MTELPPSERALTALKVSGLEESPITSLEREDALFVLTADTLVYQDGGGTRRVTLRDLTRIHSDQEGVLRVETPAGTALTASLLGFDPGQVQSFFGEVRTTTAAAKELPSSPLPSPSASKTFSSAPAPSPTLPGPTLPGPTSPSAAVSSPISPSAAAPAPAVPAVKAARLTTPEPEAVVIGELHEDDLPAAREVTPAPASRAEPVVITSSGSSPRVPRSAVDAPAAPLPPRPEVMAPAPLPPTADLQPEVTADLPVAAPFPVGLTALAPAQAVAGLARQADLVAGLPPRLRFLGVVLFVASVALAYFQFTGDQRLAALWTLLAGGVGSIALLALADLARLLEALARTASAGGGVMNVE